jgi:excisionase family DNA binding protein
MTRTQPANAPTDEKIRAHNKVVTGEALAQLHSVEDTAKRLGIGRAKTFELIADGSLRSVKVGRRRLVSEAALRRFIDGLESGELTVGETSA